MGPGGGFDGAIASPQPKPAASAPAPAAAGSASISQNDIDDLFSSDPAEDQRARDAKLLNGPALPGQGSSQEDIDAILNGTM
jgi:hypothetical protein